jgi:predicted RNase H-like HicB family nuclease
MKQHITPEQLQELSEERAKENQAPCPGVWANENMGVLTEYIGAAMQKTVLEKLDDGSWYANIPPCPGVWANEKTPEECKNTLREVLEEWLLLELLDNDPLPELDGISLKVVEKS